MMKSIEEFVLNEVTVEGCLDEKAKTTDLFEDLGLDSLEMMNLLSKVEAEFDIFITYKASLEIKSVNDLIQTVVTELEKKKSV